MRQGCRRMLFRFRGDANRPGKGKRTLHPRARKMKRFVPGVPHEVVDWEMEGSRFWRVEMKVGGDWSVLSLHLSGRMGGGSKRRPTLRYDRFHRIGCTMRAKSHSNPIAQVQRQ